MGHHRRGAARDQCVNAQISLALHRTLGFSKLNRRNTMEVLNKATARVHGAVDQVANAAVPAAKWLEEQSDTLTTGGEKMLNNTVKYIAAHPLQSLGLALAAGYVLSRLTR
jgi:hypothetical protein